MVIIQVLAILAVAFSPAFIWLAFFLKEDEHPEPTKLLIKTFSMGMLASIPALTFQMLAQKLFSDSATAYASTLFLFAASEEIFKFLSAYVVVNNNPDFDEPVDGMIYMVVAGLGFATVENIFVVGSLVGLSGLGGLVDAGQALFLRLVGATLLHTLASALIGYYWSKGVVKNNKWYFIIIGLVIALLVHGAFNYLVKEFESINVFFPTLFLVGVSFFVFSDFEKLKDSVI